MKGAKIMSETPLRDESKDRRWQIYVACMACGVAGQVIVKGLSKVPWLFLAKVTTREMVEIVNETVEWYRNKWERD